MSFNSFSQNLKICFSSSFICLHLVFCQLTIKLIRSDLTNLIWSDLIKLKLHGKSKLQGDRATIGLVIVALQENLT
jgi:hypothetical protein